MYGFATTLSGMSFDEARARTAQALNLEGFGVLSDMDVQAELKDQAGDILSPYRVLGVCHSPLAFDALQAVPIADLPLVCNVIVREVVPGQVVVEFLDPKIAPVPVTGALVKALAGAAEQRLRRACASLGAVSGL